MTADPKETAPQETEFREIFTALDENAQDRLMDAARALNFAAAIRTPGAAICTPGDITRENAKFPPTREIITHDKGFLWGKMTQRGKIMENEKDRVQKELQFFYEGQSFYKKDLKICDKGKLFYKDDDDFLLQEKCCWSGDCWKNNPKDGAWWNSFSEPYIGAEYEGGLICVGLNIHKGGGRIIQETMVNGGNQYTPGVKASLSQGKKKQVDFRSGMAKFHDADPENYQEQYGDTLYGGTALWFRIAVYAKIILDGCIAEKPSAELASVYDRIMYMDAIKCSPNTDRSRPYSAMAHNCFDNIFGKELDIIMPKNILLLSHKAAELLNDKYDPGSKDFPGVNRHTNVKTMTIANKQVNVYYVAHSNARGVRQSQLPGALLELVKRRPETP